MKFTLKKGQKLVLVKTDKVEPNDIRVELLGDTDVDFLGVGSDDALAETLAALPNLYNVHIEDLSHTETAFRNGKSVTLHVRYGGAGRRIEEADEEVKMREEMDKHAASDVSKASKDASLETDPKMSQRVDVRDAKTDVRAEAGTVAIVGANEPQIFERASDGSLTDPVRGADETTQNEARLRADSKAGDQAKGAAPNPVKVGEDAKAMSSGLATPNAKASKGDK